MRYRYSSILAGMLALALGAHGHVVAAQADSELYAVVLIGKDEVRVVSSGEVEELREQLKEQHRSELTAYREARKAAARSKEKFEEKKPIGKSLKVLANALKGKDEAERVREKHLAKLESAKGGFVVVRVGRELRVVSRAEVATIKKQALKEHRAALAEYEEARKRAAKAKEKFAAPKPRSPEFKIVSASFKTRDLAEQARQKLENPAEEDQREKRPKKKKSR